MDNAILGKFQTITMSTETGPLNTYDCTVKFSTKMDKQPVKQHYLGRMNPSYIPDTGCEKTGTLTVADKDGSFKDFYLQKVQGQQLGDPYPVISITETTKYKNGSTKQRTWSGVMLSTESVDIEAESPLNIVYDWIAEEVS